MTFEEYIKNPMGDKNSVMANRELYRTLYKNKFDIVMLRENNRFDYKIYKHNSFYYIYIKVPSETIADFYYDVVIKFIPNKTSLFENSIKNYDVQFFSNDPRFVYVFAHAFKENKLFLDELKSRMSNKALKYKPTQTNPNEDVNYVKSLYFAYLIMKEKQLFSKFIIDPKAIPFDKNGLVASVMNADEKIEDRQKRASEMSSSRKQAKQDLKNDIQQDQKQLQDEAKNTNKKMFGNLGNVNIIGKSKSKVNIIKAKKPMKKSIGKR